MAPSRAIRRGRQSHRQGRLACSVPGLDAGPGIRGSLAITTPTPQSQARLDGSFLVDLGELWNYMIELWRACIRGSSEKYYIF